MKTNYMKIAYKESLKSIGFDDVPVGAVIVKGGKIIAKAYNKRVKNNSVIAHAETLAIEQASKKLKMWRLDECEMYVTLKPCLMCENIIKESKITKVYFSAENKKRDILSKLNINYEKIENNEEDIVKSLKEFFKNKRK